jgi:hypothetical protein
MANIAMLRRDTAQKRPRQLAQAGVVAEPDLALEGVGGVFRHPLEVRRGVQFN